MLSVTDFVLQESCHFFYFKIDNHSAVDMQLHMRTCATDILVDFPEEYYLFI